jgi:Domain of unknown function (DUF4283)
MFQASPPKPSAKACAQANALTMLKFYSNPNNKKFRATIQNSLIFHDKLELGSIYIQTYLQKLFPLQGWQWVARALPRNKYLIEPSNAEWRKYVLSKGEIDLGSVQFIVEPYDFQKFDEGSDLVFLWINITGLPSDLWKDEEFNHIALELGGFLVDVDPRSWEYIDLTILRMKIGVKSKKVVVLCRNMIFIDDLGRHMYFDLQFQVEDVDIFNRPQLYWQQKSPSTTTPSTTSLPIGAASHPSPINPTPPPVLQQPLPSQSQPLKSDHTLSSQSTPLLPQSPSVEDTDLINEPSNPPLVILP